MKKQKIQRSRRQQISKVIAFLSLAAMILPAFQNCSGFSVAQVTDLNSLGSQGANNGNGNNPAPITDPAAVGWHQMKVGAGGWLVGMDIASDGTKVVRADTYGGYIWDNSLNQWRQLVTQSSMPSGDNGPNSHSGIYEIRIAPSMTSRMYMALDGKVYRTDDSGHTWRRTTFSTTFPNVYMGANDPYRQSGWKMAIDPVNPDVVYVGTQRNGLFVTTDGGASFSAVSAVPTPIKSGTDDVGLNGIAIDSSLGTVNGKSKRIYAPSYGNGIYYSSDAGATWSRLNGGPTNVNHAIVDTAGNYILADMDGGRTENLWSYKNGVWKNFVTGNSQSAYTSVAIDSSRPGRIVAFAGSVINESVDGGNTWTGMWPLGNKVAVDVPGLNYPGGGELFSAQTLFDPLTGQIFVSGGTAVWHTTIGDTPAPYTMTSQSIGIEQLVANSIVVPPGGKPLVLSWDRAVYYIGDLTKYPSTFGPTGKFCMGWGADYASSSPNFIAGMMRDMYSPDQSGYSTDGGQTWTKYASLPGRMQTIGWLNGSVAASTPQNFIIAPGSNTLPYYTKDGGNSWTQITNIPGQSGTDGFGNGFWLKNKVVAADRVLPNTFYLYSYKLGLLRSTDGGSTWVRGQQGEIGWNSAYNSRLKTVPGQAGNLFFTAGPGAPTPFYRSVDGGNSFTAVPNVVTVLDFGFGKPAVAGGYPAIYIAGTVNNVFGIYRSDDNAASWVSLGDRPFGSLDGIVAVEGDMNLYGRVYVGFGGSGFGYYNAQ